MKHLDELNTAMLMGDFETALWQTLRTFNFENLVKNKFSTFQNDLTLMRISLPEGEMSPATGSCFVEDKSEISAVEEICTRTFVPQAEVGTWILETITIHVQYGNTTGNSYFLIYPYV